MAGEGEEPSTNQDGDFEAEQGQPSKVGVDHFEEEAPEPWVLEYIDQQHWISSLSFLSASKLDKIKERGLMGRPSVGEQLQELDVDTLDYLTVSTLKDATSVFLKLSHAHVRVMRSTTALKKKLESKDVELRAKKADLTKVHANLDLSSTRLREIQDRYKGVGQLLETIAKDDRVCQIETIADAVHEKKVRVGNNFDDSKWITPHKTGSKQAVRNGGEATTSNGLCLVCDDAPESHNHLFFECIFTKNLVVFVEKWALQMHWPKNILELHDRVLPAKANLASKIMNAITAAAFKEIKSVVKARVLGLYSTSQKKKDQYVLRSVFQVAGGWGFALHLAVLASSSGSEFDEEVADIRSSIVNEKNEPSETALFIATEKGHLEVVKELMQYVTKEVIFIKNHSGFDPLHIAASQGHKEIVLHKWLVLSWAFGWD
ncbi:hypothetical protein G4B88_029492 [Cannabis sativa]|uniref:Uncharacterized protein n=1 Tax=Cannabis sativa TaxID=3483 RepID=A0A7J6EWD2_CANSA|nr:hypothetical protein G4B88_029492 [Cannabis sativa]